jgi:hypothetical protein
MQKKKNIRLLILLAVLCMITVIVYFFNSGNTAEAVDKNIFRVDDLKTIDKFVFESTGTKVELKFNGSRWKVNGKYNADRNLVDLLFATLQEVQPKRPASSSLRDSLSRALEANGVKVSLFRNDNKISTFYAGGNEVKTQAYFKREAEAMPYLMVIPGYRDYASAIVELNEEGWRDKRVFNFNWRNFKSLEATFSSDPEQNFKVSFINSSFGIEGIAQCDTTKLNNYLDAISLLVADQFIEKGFSARYDSLINTQPSVVIEVKDVGDRSHKLSIFNPLTHDLRIVGQLAENEFVVFQRQRIFPLVRGRDFFKQKQGREQ